MSDIDLSIVILSWNTLEDTRVCLQSLRDDSTERRREIIVVDNASHDGSPDMIEREFPEVILIRNTENMLYAEGNNQGARQATGRFLCLLNSDTKVRPGALDTLVSFLETHETYGAASPKLLNFDGTIQPACSRFPGLLDPLLDSTVLGRFWPGSALVRRTRMADFDHLVSRDVNQPPAACMMVRLDEYLKMGGFDPELALFFNDVDLCKRLSNNGRRIRFVAEAEVFHHRGLSVHRLGKSTHWQRNRTAYYRKHYGRLGEMWLRFVLRLWALQVRCGIRLGRRSPEDKQAAMDDLKQYVQACLDPST